MRAFLVGLMVVSVVVVGLLAFFWGGPMLIGNYALSDSQVKTVISNSSGDISAENRFYRAERANDPSGGITQQDRVGAGILLEVGVVIALFFTALGLLITHQLGEYICKRLSITFPQLKNSV